MRIRISRKEAKETIYWLRLIIDTNDDQFMKEGEEIVKESIDPLIKDFSTGIPKFCLQLRGNFSEYTLYMLHNFRFVSAKI